MDRLTLLVLSKSAPQTAFIYTAPLSIVKVAPLVECAVCANAYVESSYSSPIYNYRLATRADVKEMYCGVCGKDIVAPDS